MNRIVDSIKLVNSIKQLIKVDGQKSINKNLTTNEGNVQ